MLSGTVQIHHRIVVEGGEEGRRAVVEGGLGRIEGPEQIPVAVIDVAEDDPNWPAVCELIARFPFFDDITTTYTDDEVDAGSWVRVTATVAKGYPQPEDGWRERSYDLSEYCRVCGIGARQVRPIQIQRSLRVAQRSILRLNWIPDELITHAELWRAVWKPHEVAARSVELAPDGADCGDLVQLDFSAQAASQLDIPETHPRHVCASCGRVKYAPLVRGPMPPFRGNPGIGPTVRSLEWFGQSDSGAAYQIIAVAARVYRSMLDAEVRGLRYAPIHQDGDR
jgi:hypothetical protein